MSDQETHKNMATFLDVGLIKAFDVILPFLLVFAIVYAILHKTKLIGESPAFNAIVAISAAFMVLISDTIAQIINFSVPWFVVTIIFLILLVLLFQTLGAKEADIAKAVGDKTVQWILIGITLIILIAAFASVFGQQLTERSMQGGAPVINGTTGNVATADLETNIYATFYHPKVLGFLVIFGIAIAAVFLLSGSVNK